MIDFMLPDLKSQRGQAVDPKFASDLALEYFRIGNGIVAFHVVQTLLFLNSIHTSPVLLKGIVSDRGLARKIAWGLTILYTSVITSSGGMELFLRWKGGEGCWLTILTLLAALGRITVVILLGFGCSKIIGLVKDVQPGAPTPA